MRGKENRRLPYISGNQIGQEDIKEKREIQPRRDRTLKRYNEELLEEERFHSHNFQTFREIETSVKPTLHWYPLF